jgi:hypothetical protein
VMACAEGQGSPVALGRPGSGWRGEKGFCDTPLGGVCDPKPPPIKNGGIDRGHRRQIK